MCELRKTASGDTVIVCTRGQRRPGGLPTCVRCKAVAAFLCDGPADKVVGQWKDDEAKGRCSAPLCEQHAYVEPDGSHRCWHHRSKEAKIVKSEKVRLLRR